MDAEICITILWIGFALLVLMCAGCLVWIWKNISKDPDGIIAVTITDEGKVKANFILCLPVDEFVRKDRVTFEIQQLEDSQEIQDS